MSDPEGGQLLALAAKLVDIPSVSHSEAEIASFVEGWLEERCSGAFEIARLEDNVCARSSFGLPERLIIAGHLDTVPPNGNEGALLEGDMLSGLGSADMKGGVAVAMELARSTALAATSCGRLPAVDLTFVFYACEEVDQRYSGLGRIEARDPTWLEADAAVLGEPTGAAVEAGCQGVLRLSVEARGERAHSARPWKGSNAIHRLAPVLEALTAYSGRRVVIDGCEYQEALQAVAVAGGVANNVVPDSAVLTLNHRFAPDRSADEAAEAVRAALLGEVGEPARYRFAVEDSAAPAAPSLEHPLLAALVAASGRPPRAKLGWTDVSYFYARGIPAANFGPGDPTLAHSAGERVAGAELTAALRTLSGVVAPGAAAERE